MRRLIGLTALLLVCGSPLAAQQPAAELQGACAYDVPKFCGDVKRGGGRIQQCLRQHASELSPQCKEQIASAQKRGAGQSGVAPWALPCRADMAALCKDVEPGQGRIRKCLEADPSKLSAGCKAALENKGPGKGKGQGPGKGPGAAAAATTPAATPAAAKK